jgi:hypothetical protein
MYFLQTSLMKRISLLASLFCLLLTACSKNNKGDNSGKAGTIAATVDGSNVSFNTTARAMRTDISGAYSIQIIGFQGAAGSSNQIAIAVSDNSPIVTGIYNETLTGANGVGSVSYIQSGTALPYINNRSTANPGTVTITEVNATSVKGTFSGDVFLMTNGGISTTKKSITNGQFFVNF